MSKKTPKNPAAPALMTKKSYVMAFAIAGSALTAGLGITSIPSQAAGLGDLFSNDSSTAQPKFLPVEQAFQVTSSSKASANGTRLNVNLSTMSIKIS